MYYAIGVSVSSIHRESTDSLIESILVLYTTLLCKIAIRMIGQRFRVHLPNNQARGFKCN